MAEIKSVEERLSLLERENAALRARLESLESATGLFASDKELSGQHGDPVVKFSPRNWRGPDFKGQQFSKCSAEFLDVLAEALAYSAAHPKDGKEKFVPYNLADAAKARSWSRRIRSGGAPAAPKPFVPDFREEPAAAFEAEPFVAPAGDTEAFGGSDFGFESPEFKDDAF
jgi:hypothetical protein